MTSEQRAEARARIESTTPGPWFIGDDGWPFWWEEGKGSLPVWFSAIDDSEENPYRPYTISFDALKFIAHARTDLPMALDEIDRLELQVENWPKTSESREDLFAACQKYGTTEGVWLSEAALKTIHLLEEKIKWLNDWIASNIGKD